MFDKTKPSFIEYSTTYYNLALNDFLKSYEDNDELLFIQKEIEFFLECIDATDVKKITEIQLLWGQDGGIYYTERIFDCLTNRLLHPNFEESFKNPLYINMDLRDNLRTSFNKIIEFLEHKKETINSKHHNNPLELISDTKHDNIFSNNGFVLFDHIMANYVKVKRGRLSDIHFFYRSMYEDKFIHQRPEQFKEWFLKNHDEDLGKIKTYNEVENSDRKKHYSNALEWFKQQNI
jgi:hypothetical protein